MKTIANSSKDALRRHHLARRNELTDRERRERSFAICERALQVNENLDGVTACYWPIRSEVDTRPLMDAMLETGRRVALPVVLGKTELEFRAYMGAEDLIEAGFGTKGPSEAAPVIAPEILFVPLSVFDRKGNRIGYGAGHYDRAFERLEAQRNIYAIALAFACQETDHVPSEPHDRRMDLVITENEVITPEELA
ncbi:MAG: 5-formyltetrahydrofolate cyclo-ligase [Pseudomonadota bacterium]